MLVAMAPRPVAHETPAASLAVAAFLDACRCANTRAAYQADLAQIAAWCREGGTLDLLSIDTDDVARYRTACELAGAAPATVARRLSTVSSVSAFASANGARPVLRPEAVVERPSIESTSSTELLDDADADALLRAADETGPRAAALLRLLLLDGLKVGEVIRADAGDVGGRPPRVRLSIRDRRPRTIDLHRDTGSALRRYLGGRRDGPLLLSERRGREPQRLTRFGVDYLLKQVARAAGITQSVSSNVLRRRFVMTAHAHGSDLDDIRRQAGHAQARTTRRYLENEDSSPTSTPTPRP
jgi:site-specific recombinase XerD